MSAESAPGPSKRPKRKAESQVHPPRIAESLLWAALPPVVRDHMTGDLAEAFTARARRLGRGPARRWYFRQVIRSIPSALTMRVRAASHRRTERGKNQESLIVETLLQDLRYGLRSIIRTPGFAVVSIVTLALAIGVNTAIFSLVNVIVFADLPMEDPERVAVIRSDNPSQSLINQRLSGDDFLDFLEENRSFSFLAASRGDQWVLTGADGPKRVEGFKITPSLFDVWSISTVLGRRFLPDDANPGSIPVAVLAHGFWQRSFGGRFDVLGESIRLDGTEYSIVGVMPPRLEFANLADLDVWVPLVVERGAESRNLRNLRVTGILGEGVGPDQAKADVENIGLRISDANPDTHRGWIISAEMTRESLVDDELWLVLALLGLCVAFVLLIACANVANMLLARATTRSRELAVRAAIGARRIRIVRQLLTESLVIAIASAGLGLAISQGLIQLLIWITRGNQDLFNLATIDQRVLLFTILVAVVAPLGFGLFPALQASRTEVSDALREGSARAGGSRKGERIRGILVGGQISLAVMSMVIAGLLARSVINMVGQELGFEADRVLSLRLDIPESKYGDEGAIRAFYDDALSAIRTTPGVTGAGMVEFLPAVERGIARELHIEGRVIDGQETVPTVLMSRAGSEYLAVMEIGVLSGRGFSLGDSEGGVSVALVARETANRYWPGEDPIGVRIRLGAEENAELHQIVGIVDDVRSSSSDDGAPDPQLYLPFRQNPVSQMAIMIKATADPEALAGQVRSAIWSVDPDQPVDDVETLRQTLYEEAATTYALGFLFAAFALFALVMAAVGVFGVLSYSVGQRSREFGLRMALGAESGSVLRMVMKQGVTILVVGICLGLVGAFILVQLIGSLLVGVTSYDPVTFIGVPAILGFVALLANYIPALRATRVDPMTVLRME